MGFLGFGNFAVLVFDLVGLNLVFWVFVFRGLRVVLILVVWYLHCGVWVVISQNSLEF